MNLIPWRARWKELSAPSSDLAPFDQLRREMDRMFDQFTGGTWEDDLLPTQGAVGTAIDVTESNDEVLVRAELPGVDPKEVDLTLTGNVLTLSGEKREELEEKGEGWHRSERSFGAFRRSLQLPSDVDANRVEAAYKNGVLTIRIKKTEAARPRRIDVKSS